MNWTEMLKNEIESTYRAAEGLIDRVDEDRLDWKPETGENWMTVAQLLLHMTTACGFCFRGFATGDWTPPESYEMPEGEGAEGMLSAEQMPAAESVTQIRELLAEDKALALRTIDEVGEERLQTQMVAAPWDPTERALGQHFLQMIGHLAQHKGQLFYYLKLQGQPVNTMHLWGAG